MSKAHQITIRLSPDEAGALSSLVTRYRRDVDASMTGSAIVRRLILEDGQRGGEGAGEVEMRGGSPFLNIRMTRWGLAMLEAIQSHARDSLAALSEETGGQRLEPPTLSEIIWRLVFTEYEAIPKAPEVAAAVESHRV